MHLSFERRQETPTTAAQKQLITLAVDSRSVREDADLVRSLLFSVNGVEAAEPDPTSARVWIFAHGGIEPESLVEALASWGYGSYVLDNQLTATQ